MRGFAVLPCRAVVGRLVALIAVVVLCGASPSVAQEVPLLAAIAANDGDEVSVIVRQGADVDAFRGTFPQLARTALYEAVGHGNAGIVITLLDAGADVNLGLDNPEAGFGAADAARRYSALAALSPLGLAVQRNDAEIVALLIARGAQISTGHLLLAKDARILQLVRAAAPREKVEQFGALHLASALRQGDTAALRQTVNDPDQAAALKALGSSTDLLLAYTYAGVEFRRALAESGPPAVAAGQSNLLDWLLAGRLEIEAPGDARPKGGFDRRLAFPLATTFLDDERNPLRYSERTAFDGDPATSWVEGVEGPGLHQKIAFMLPDGASGFSVLAGYGDERYYSLNNRVRLARLSVCEITPYEAAPGPATGYMVDELAAKEIELQDTLSEQSFALPMPGAQGRAGRTRIVVFEILAVYPGTRWDDTCVAEIGVCDSRGARLQITSGPIP